MSDATIKVNSINGGVVNATITNTTNIDIDHEMKENRKIRADYRTAWIKLLNAIREMDGFVQHNKLSNELLTVIEEEVGETYVMPDIENQYNLEEELLKFQAWDENESKLRKEFTERALARWKADEEAKKNNVEDTSPSEDNKPIPTKDIEREEQLKAASNE